MASINPVIAFNFLQSLSSVYGESLTLSLFNSATRNDTAGLVLTANNSRASAAAPSSLQLALPITLWARVVRVATGGGSTAGFGLDNNADDSWRVAFEHRGTAAGWRMRGLNGTTLVTLTSSITPVNPETVNYFLQFTSSAYTAWQDTTQALNSAASRAAPDYTGTPTLYFGRAQFGAYVTHAAIYSGVLTADDRAAIVADPRAAWPAATPRLRAYLSHLLR